MLELGPNGLEVGERWLPLKSKPTRADRSSQDSYSPPGFSSLSSPPPSPSLPPSFFLSHVHWLFSLSVRFLRSSQMPTHHCLCSHFLADSFCFDFSPLLLLISSHGVTNHSTVLSNIRSSFYILPVVKLILSQSHHFFWTECSLFLELISINEDVLLSSSSLLRVSANQHLGGGRVGAWPNVKWR